MDSQIAVQVVKAPIISGQANEGGNVVSPTHRPPLPPGRSLVLISVRDLSRPQEHTAESIKYLKNSIFFCSLVLCTSSVLLSVS
jgi:hypothetical protein